MRTLEHLKMNISAWKNLGIDPTANESNSQNILDSLESTLDQLDGVLSEFGSISRPSQSEHFEIVYDALDALKNCRRELSEDIATYINLPLKRRFNELDDIISTIDQKNISTPNRLGIEVKRYYNTHSSKRGEYREKLEDITMEDILGIRENSNSTVYEQKIPVIEKILKEKYNYEVSKINAMMSVDIRGEFSYNEYKKMNYVVSEQQFVKDMTSLEKIEDSIWRATGIGYIIDSVNGYSIINGDHLTRKECNARAIEGTVIMGFYILPGVVDCCKGVGLTEALMCSVKVFEYIAIWMATQEIEKVIDVPELKFVIGLLMLTTILYEAGKVDYVTERGVAKVSEEVDDVGREIEGVIKKDLSNEGYRSGAEVEELLAEKYGFEEAGLETKSIELCNETSYGKSSPNLEKTKGWKVGDPIDNLTKAGNEPSWNTVKKRYWRNEAYYNGELYSERNLEFMKKGNAPHYSEAIDVPMELHHIEGRKIPNPHNESNLLAVWPWEHDAIDPYRFYTGPRP